MLSEQRPLGLMNVGIPPTVRTKNAVILKFFISFLEIPVINPDFLKNVHKLILPNCLFYKNSNLNLVSNSNCILNFHLKLLLLIIEVILVSLATASWIHAVKGH